eukprot:6194097-Pleurochrysis_carterae.AAC.3
MSDTHSAKYADLMWPREAAKHAFATCLGVIAESCGSVVARSAAASPLFSCRAAPCAISKYKASLSLC